MKSLHLHDWVWRLQKIASASGFWGVFGACVALVSCLIGYAEIDELNQKAQALQSALSQQSLQNSDKPVTMPVVGESTQTTAENDAETYTRFYQQFDGAQALTKQLGAISRIATQQGIQLNRGDYKVTKLKQSVGKQALLQYQVTLPIKAQYLQIQRLIATVMQDNASLALTDLQITRDSHLNPIVDARVVFTLFFKGEM